MKKLIIIFSLITTNLFSQNKDSYLATVIQDDLYNYFDGLGTKQLYTKSDCDCEMYTETVMLFFVDKDDSKSLDIDGICLNDAISDEDVIDYLDSYEKFLKERGVVFKDVNIDIDIKREYIRFNIFRFRYKVKYKVIVTYNFKPIKKISK